MSFTPYDEHCEKSAEYGQKKLRPENKPKASEQQIVNSILDYLTFLKIAHLHVRNTGNIFHKEGKTFFGKSGKQVGAPDIIGCYKRCGFAIEVKSETGKISVPQKEWCSRWMGPNSHGFWILARNIYDVESLLRIIDDYTVNDTHRFTKS